MKISRKWAGREGREKYSEEKKGQHGLKHAGSNARGVCV